MCRVLLQVLTQPPDPAGPPLQPHLLRPLPGKNVQAGGRHLHCLLPPVPLDYLHPGQSDVTWSPVGQHRDLGPDCGGAEVEGRSARGGFERRKDPTHDANATCFKAVWFHINAPEVAQLRAAAEREHGRVLTV